MLQCQKDLFNLDPEVSYLNCAYMSPQLKSVEKMGAEMVRRKSQPWNIHVADFFEPVHHLKTLFSRLVNIRDPERVAVIPSASYGLATVARNVALKPGRKIIVAAEQFPSNYYIWQRIAGEAGATVKVVSPPPVMPLTAAWNEAILDAIGPDTAVVALGNVHWANGIRFDLEAIRARTRRFGALLIIDGTQSVGALPFDVEKIQPDALVVAGYKWLLGPYSISAAYFGPAFDDGVPIEENWINRKNSDDFRRLVEYQAEYRPKAGRYSMGEQSNFILAPMLAAAIEQLLEWGVENIQAYCTNISRPFTRELQQLGILTEPEGDRCGHLFGLRVDAARLDVNELKNQLAANRIHVSFRSDSIRVAPNVYNTEADLQRLLEALKVALLP